MSNSKLFGRSRSDPSSSGMSSALYHGNDVDLLEEKEKKARKDIDLWELKHGKNRLVNNDIEKEDNPLHVHGGYQDDGNDRDAYRRFTQSMYDNRSTAIGGSSSTYSQEGSSSSVQEIQELHYAQEG